MKGVSTRLALVVLVFALVSTIKTCKSTKQTKPNAEFIKSSCGKTPYPTLCFASMSSHSSAIAKDPKELAQTALSVSLESARSTCDFMSNLSEKHGLKKREVEAMKDCVKTVSDSIDELNRSLKDMGHLKGRDFEFQKSNIRTWVSAALTDDDTCMDGVEETAVNGRVMQTVRKHIRHVARLTSNALALISNLNS